MLMILPVMGALISILISENLLFVLCIGQNTDCVMVLQIGSGFIPKLLNKVNRIINVF